MLIDFTFSNFRSFKDEAVLSAETGERLYKYKKTNTFSNLKVPVLKNLLIFGPNGAGKSQIFHAMELMRHIVMNGGTQAVTDELPYDPFKFSKDNEQPTKFEVRFEKDNIVYEYSFSYDSEHIISEQLKTTRKKETTVFFSCQNGKVIQAPDDLKDAGQHLRKNALFLFIAQQQNDLVAAQVYRWFTQDIVFVEPNVGIQPEYLKLMQNSEIKKEVVSFLNFADFNISDIVVHDVPFPLTPQAANIIFQNISKKQIPKTIPRLFTIHKSYGKNGQVIGSEELPLSAESVGTQKLFVIVLAMIYAQVTGNGKTIFIDEFDDSLHFELANALVRIFNSTVNNNQYIITTHTYKMLDSGIRVDQIYFVEKDFRGCSDLKSAFDFTDSRGNARRDARFAKKYIEGRYGAVPVIDTQSLLETLRKVKKSIGEEKHGKKAEE